MYCRSYTYIQYNNNNNNLQIIMQQLEESNASMGQSIDSIKRMMNYSQNTNKPTNNTKNNNRVPQRPQQTVRERPPHKKKSTYEKYGQISDESDQSSPPKIDEKEIPKYQSGSFSKYAVKKQVIINANQAMIDDVIKEAMLSHLEKVKHYLKRADVLKRQSKQIQLRIAELVGREDNVYRIIKSPVEQFTKIFMEGRKESKTAFQYIQHFIQIIFQIKNLRLVDGKLIDLNKYIVSSMKDSMDHNLLLQSKTDQNIYVKVGPERLATNLFYYGGSLHTKNQLLTFSAEERKIMIGMIISFLKSKGIVSSEQQILDGMNNHIQATLSAIT